MKLVVGLGNPGGEYEGTRHNVGFMAVDAMMQNQKSKVKSQNQNLKFKSEKKFESEVCRIGEVLLVKPGTFMNKSGEAVSKVIGFYKVSLDDLYVVHDDLDIGLGEYKVQMGKGPKLHGGVGSVEEKLGTGDFWRVRVGVENRGGMERLDGRVITEDTEALEGTDDVSRIPGEKYVLQNFERDERRVVDEVIERVVDELWDRVVG